MDKLDEKLGEMLRVIANALHGAGVDKLANSTKQVTQALVTKPGPFSELTHEEVHRIRQKIELAFRIDDADGFVQTFWGKGMSHSDPCIDKTLEFACIRYVSDDCDYITVRTLASIGAVHVALNRT